MLKVTYFKINYKVDIQTNSIKTTSGQGAYKIY